jgi:hypothetical protein
MYERHCTRLARSDGGAMQIACGHDLMIARPEGTADPLQSL